MVATISGFLLLYGVAAYILVSRGLGFIHKTPLFGPLLTERLVYLLFFFFFVMLVISNATITGMGLFRRKDMEWQVALPLPDRSLVLWKTLEGMTLASWGLIVLSAPILLALGRTPNTADISRNVQVVNENPAKTVGVALAATDRPDEVDATIRVADDDPSRVVLSVDNTGNSTTGQLRASVGYLNANLTGRDCSCGAPEVHGARQ